MPVTLDIRFGDPAREILACAAEGIDLVVIASHGMSAAKRLLLGSVAEEVQRLAPVPVLLVKAVSRQIAASPPASDRAATELPAPAVEADLVHS